MTITFTTTGTLTVVSGSDKLHLNGTVLTVTNTLTANQNPVSGTTNEYTTTATISDSDGVSDSGVSGIVTINYVGPSSSSNSIATTFTIPVFTQQVTGNATVSVPSLSSLEPEPILSTPLTSSDMLTLTDPGNGDTSTYTLTSGTLSSSPAAPMCGFSVTPTTVNFGTNSGSQTVSLTATSGCAWTATSPASWLTISPSAGTGTGGSTPINLTVGANGGPAQSTVVTIGGEGSSATVNVSQNGTGCSFSLSTNSLTFASSGGTMPISISGTGGCSWDVVNLPSWLTASPLSGTLPGNSSTSLTATPNGTTERSATISVANQSVTVTQPGSGTGCTFSLNPTSLSFPATGGTGGGLTQTIQVTASSQSCVWTTSSQVTWATVTPSAQQTGSQTVSVVASPNTSGSTLSGTVTIAGTVVPVTQAAPTGCVFSVSPSSLTFLASPGMTQNLQITASNSSCQWTVSNSPSWLSLSTTGGVGTMQLGVTSYAYTGSSQQTGNLTVAGITIPVTQGAVGNCSSSVTPTSLSFPAGGGPLTVNLTSTCQNWSTGSTVNWLSLAPSTGSNNAQITVTATANTSTSAQSGSVTIAGVLVNVTQSGMTPCTYTVSPSTLNFPSAGGTMPVTLTAQNQSCMWTAVSNASWASVSPVTGSGSTTVNVTAETNNTANALTGSVSIAGQLVNLTQSASASACMFTVSGNQVQFQSTGGAIVRSILASGPTCAWTASSTSPWLTLSASTGTGSGNITITAAGNQFGAQETGSVNIAGTTIPVIVGGLCTFSVYPTYLSADQNGGTQVLQLTPSGNASCTWSAAGTSFATPSSTTGTGAGTLSVVISPNTTGVDRSGVLQVAGVTIPVSQGFTVQAFQDVPPSAYYFDAVNLMAQKQLTDGCGTDIFCPTEDLTRAQMAIFLVRAAFGGDNFTASTSPYFNDVPQGSFGFQWIQKLFELGITAGCGNNDFCPNAAVTRDEMAIFLVRSRLGAYTVFNYPTTPIFNDVPLTYFAFPWIQRLASDNITAGCGNNDYCPLNTITRGDMAILLMRADYNLLLSGSIPIITQVAPNFVTQGGQPQTITITGVNTNFVQGTTTISAIPGVTVGTINVASPTVLTAVVTVSPTAPVQPNPVLVITGAEEAVMPNGLQVQQ